MTDIPEGQSGWRLADQTDLQFFYHLAATLDPRWWQISKDFLSPESVIAKVGTYAAGAVVLNNGFPCGFAGLRGHQKSDVAFIDFLALPDEGSVETVTKFAPQLLRAAFEISPVRRLLYERFEDDPHFLEILGGVCAFEYVLPEFALIDGRYVDRLSYAIDKDEFVKFAADRGEA